MAADTTLKVALYLYGVNLCPDRISTAIGVRPDKAWKKGDVIGNYKSANPVVAKVGVWMFRSSVTSKSIEDHLDEIVSKISGAVQGPLLSLPGVQDAKIDIFVLEAADQECEFSIRSDRLVSIGERGLRLDFSLGAMRPGE